MARTDQAGSRKTRPPLPSRRAAFTGPCGRLTPTWPITARPMRPIAALSVGWEAMVLRAGHRGSRAKQSTGAVNTLTTRSIRAMGSRNSPLVCRRARVLKGVHCQACHPGRSLLAPLLASGRGPGRVFAQAGGRWSRQLPGDACGAADLGRCSQKHAWECCGCPDVRKAIERR